MTLHLIKTQKVLIRKLQTSPGIFPFKLDTFRIKIIIVNSATPFQRKSLQNSYKQLDFEVSTLNQKFIHYFQKEDQNGVGELNRFSNRKCFTGNMDAQDAQETIQNKIIRIVNKKISLTRKC